MTAVGLDDEVNMIRLHGEVEDAELRARRGPECRADGGEHPTVSQRRQTAERA